METHRVLCCDEVAGELCLALEVAHRRQLFVRPASGTRFLEIRDEVHERVHGEIFLGCCGGCPSIASRLLLRDGKTAQHARQGSGMNAQQGGRLAFVALALLQCCYDQVPGHRVQVELLCAGAPRGRLVGKGRWWKRQICHF